MSVNLIQNYVNTQVPKQQSVKPAPYFDIQKELDNRAFIKPLKAKGKLVNQSIFNFPALTLKNAIYNIKSLAHAIKGKANDHELGKINDTGLALGGLGIASYLMTKKVTPMTKGMEFIGLASFLASMSLWPKLAIQLPAYLIHGVNVKKEYEDSFGRRKPFYQDPQFIPWDLYKDEEIQKIGDRLGVPKDIPNRRDFIQEKMKKIAVQNNTLWMLTAGFATPVMSALICNQAEPLLNKYFNNRQNKKADKIINDIEGYSKKYQDNNIQKNLNKLLNTHKNERITLDLIDSIAETLSEGIDLVSKNSLRKDVIVLLDKKEYAVNETLAEDIAKNIKEVYSSKNFSQNFIDNISLDKSAITKIFSDNNFLGKTVTPAEIPEIIRHIALSISQRVNEFNKTVPESEQQDAKHIRGMILSLPADEHPIKKAIEKNKTAILDTTKQNALKKIAQIIDDFKARNYALDEYAIIKTGSAPETVCANFWNDTKKQVLKIFGFSSKDIEQARIDRTALDIILRDKIENIVSDDATYKKVLDEISRQVASLHNEIKPSDMAAVFSNPENSVYEQQVDAIFNSTAEELKKANFKYFSDAITGGSDSVGSYKKIQKAFVSDKLLGIESSLNRIINNLIFFRQIATDPNKMPALKNYVRETKEELVELCKIITLQGHSSDYTTKFYMKRNPNPDKDYSDLEVKDGKIINKYIRQPHEVVDIPGDKYFYQDAMRLMYETDIDSESLQILERNQMKDRIIKYRTLMLEKVGSEYYFPKPRHLIRPRTHTPSDIKFQLVGMATDEYFFKAMQESFNSNKWLKIVSGIGVGLLGITIASQFFFGKMKNPRQVNND